MGEISRKKFIGNESDKLFINDYNLESRLDKCDGLNFRIAQQYGITIWGVSDNAKEHQYWLPNESPTLWDENYVHKVYNDAGEQSCRKRCKFRFLRRIIKP